MERGSLVGGLLLMLECLFSIFKVYDKESLFEFIDLFLRIASPSIVSFLKIFFRGIGSEE